MVTRVPFASFYAHTQGDLKKAKPMFEQAIAIWENVHGKFHPLVATGYNNLGSLLEADVSVPETNLDWENLFLVCTAPRRF